MKYCEDCGCHLSNGICSNCQEELYIYNEQYEEDPFPMSAEFKEKIDEQRKLLKNRMEKP